MCTSCPVRGRIGQCPTPTRFRRSCAPDRTSTAWPRATTTPSPSRSPWAGSSSASSPRPRIWTPHPGATGGWDATSWRASGCGRSPADWRICCDDARSGEANTHDSEELDHAHPRADGRAAGVGDPRPASTRPPPTRRTGCPGTVRGTWGLGADILAAGPPAAAHRGSRDELPAGRHRSGPGALWGGRQRRAAGPRSRRAAGHRGRARGPGARDGHVHRAHARPDPRASARTRVDGAPGRFPRSVGWAPASTPTSGSCSTPPAVA